MNLPDRFIYAAMNNFFTSCQGKIIIFDCFEKKVLLGFSRQELKVIFSTVFYTQIQIFEPPQLNGHTLGFHRQA